MRTTLLLLATVAALGAASAFPAQAHASSPTLNEPRADLLFQQAMAQERQPSASFTRHLRQTARLYLKSAELRDASDPLKAESLQRAGALLMSVEPRRARELFAQAAELALARGDVVRSAHFYLDAAWVGETWQLRSARDRLAANEYIRKAHLLADAPLLSVEQRGSILKRIRPAADATFAGVAAL
jgi:hypothetical protein